MRLFFYRLSRIALVFCCCGGLWAYLTRGLETAPDHEGGSEPVAADVLDIVSGINAEFEQVWEEQKLAHAARQIGKSSAAESPLL